MAYTTVYKGIIFIEGTTDFEKEIGNLSFSNGGIGNQLKNLNNVKDSFVVKAKLLGGNCIINFQYGQKSSWISLDDTKWWGKRKVCEAFTKRI